MNWTLVTVLLLAPIAAILLALIAFAMIPRRRFPRKACPRCEQPALWEKGGARATTLVDGTEAPDASSYYLCDGCGAHLKWDRNAWSETDREEWERSTLNNLYSVDREGYVSVFEDLFEAEMLEWNEVVDSEYVIIDDRGVVYEHYDSAEGFYGYKLRPTDVKLPEALAILQRHVNDDTLDFTELRTVETDLRAHGLSR